jgi:hypothetical protein
MFLVFREGWKKWKILEKPEKTQIFVWEPIEGFNLEPRFFYRDSFQAYKNLSPKGEQIGWVVLIDVVDTNLDSRRQTDGKMIFAINHFLSIQSHNSPRT